MLFLSSKLTYTDIALLEQLKTGDEVAFTELYNRYHKAIYSYVLDFVKVPAIAEDITHEVFMKIWEARARITIDKSFSSYLYRVSHNKAIDALKKIASDAALRKQVENSINPILLKVDVDPERHDHFEQLYLKALSQLTPQRQKVFILCREQGKTYDEAAEELGISRNTVKQHMILAMRFLRSYLSETGDLAFLVLLLVDML